MGDRTQDCEVDFPARSDVGIDSNNSTFSTHRAEDIIK